MLLSIGMIVKNEEKYLDECLSALMPILNNIDSELIIADTGSTDSTVSIAKKYTDKVFYFEWCDDFAAARNFTLEKSTGKWFMYVDADEILKSADGIIEFFKSKEYLKYNCAMYLIRNFTDDIGIRYADLYSTRLYKKTNTTRFNGHIHEAINMVQPYAAIKNAIFYHYGYNFEDEELKKYKTERNLKLLLDKIEAEPDNELTHTQIAEVYSVADQEELAIEHYKKSLEISKRKNKKIFVIISFANLIYSYLSKSKNFEAYEEIKNYFETKEDNASTDIDIYCAKSIVSYRLGKYEECIEAYDMYAKLLDKYGKNANITTDITIRPLYSTNPRTLYELKITIANAYIALKRYADAYDIITSDTFADCAEFDNLFRSRIKIEFTVMRELDNYDRANLLYNSVINDKDKIITIRDFIEMFMAEFPEQRSKIIKALSQNDIVPRDSYIELMKISYEDLCGNRNVGEMVEEFICDTEEFNVNYADILYYAMKYNISIDMLMHKIDPYDLNLYIKNMCIHFDDYSNVVMDYSYEDESILETLWYTILLEGAMVISSEEDNFVCERIYNIYIDKMKKYLYGTYHENILTDENMLVLQPPLRFGYYCLMADKALYRDDKVNYVKYLNSALAVNQSKKNVIKMLIDKFEEDTGLSEFEKLAKTVKKNIYDLIDKGNYSDAAAVLREYKEINPYDSEIKDIERKILN